jgi:hypothetical protein
VLIVDGEVAFEPIDAFVVFKMLIVAKFIIQVKQNEKCCGKSQRQTENIYDGIEFIPAEVPACADYIVANHKTGNLSSSIMLKNMLV